MAAIKTSAVAGKAVESIEGIGKMAGDAAKKLPGMLPVPGPGYIDKDGKKQNYSISHLQKLP